MIAAVRSISFDEVCVMQRPKGKVPNLSVYSELYEEDDDKSSENLLRRYDAKI